VASLKIAGQFLILYISILFICLFTNYMRDLLSGKNDYSFQVLVYLSKINKTTPKSCARCGRK